jgi:hypothetical protein
MDRRDVSVLFRSSALALAPVSRATIVRPQVDDIEFRVPPASSIQLFCSASEVVDEHLLDGFVVGYEDVADGVSADEAANFFGDLGVIAGGAQG